MTLAQRLVMHADEVTIREATDAERSYGSTTKARRPARVTLRSGGRRRDVSLNPIIARVRDELVALAEEYAKAEKYSADQPRDDQGQWTSGGISFEGLDALDSAMVTPAQARIEDLNRRFPWAPLGTVKAANDMAPWTVAATTEPDENGRVTMGLNAAQWSPGASYYPDKGGADWYAAGPEPEAVVTHEFGHVAQAYLESEAARGSDVGKAYEAWWAGAKSGAGSLSGYAREGGDDEKFAEAFAATYGRVETSDPVGLDRFLRAHGLSQDELVKYSPDQPRDDHGRWTDEGGSFSDAFPIAGYDARHPGVLGAGAKDGNANFEASLIQLGRLQEQFPEFKISFVDIQKPGTGMFGGDDATKSLAVYLPGHGMSPAQIEETNQLLVASGLDPLNVQRPDGGGILLNGNYWAGEGRWPGGEGFLAVPFPEGQITHEFAHGADTIMNRLAATNDPRGTEWVRWRQEVSARYYSGESPSWRDLSGYAKTSNTFKEAFAEAFSLAYTPGQDESKWTPIQASAVAELRAALAAATK